jgi:hypothetical protein
MRFTLRQLMTFVAFVAVGCGGLLHPSAWLASAIFTLTVIVLFVAVLAAVGRSGAARAFWIGFAIAGWGYLWVAHWPDEESYLVNPQWQFQTTGPLLTTKLLGRVHTALHPPPKVRGGGFFSVAPERWGMNPNGSIFSSLPFAQFAAPAPTPAGAQPTLDAFMRIGHSLWALLFAYLGGRLTRALRETKGGS